MATKVKSKKRVVLSHPKITKAMKKRAMKAVYSVAKKRTEKKAG
jgi:hypothetical protein